MHEFETQLTPEKSKVAWRSIVIPSIWIVLAFIPLMILIVLQHQVDQELSAFKIRASNEQQKLAELNDKVQLNRDLGMEIERLKPKVQRDFQAFGLAEEMPSIEAALPIIHRQNDNCWWIWVPAGNHAIELCSELFPREQDSNPTNFDGHFSRLKKTASFPMNESGWYRFRYERPGGSDLNSELEFEFKDFQRDDTQVIPLGIKRVSSTGSYSSYVDHIYWPNMIPTSVVRNTGSPVTNSQLVKKPTPLLQKLSFSTQDQTLYCCIKLSINLQQDDSASTEPPYAGDYQQLERAILESHRFMR